MPSAIRRTGAGLLLLAWCCSTQAQVVFGDRERLAFDRPESWALARAAASTLFLDDGTGADPGRRRWAVVVELGSIPHVDGEDTRVGFNGLKREDLNTSPVFGRIRAVFRLPAGFRGEFGWTPPIEVSGVEADDLFAIAVARHLWRGDAWQWDGRAYLQRGGVTGAITCSDDVFELGSTDPQANPFACAARSTDEVTLDLYGAEITLRRTLADGRWRPFASLAYSRIDASAQVDAPLLGGFVDRSVRDTEGDLWTFSVGAGYRFSAHWSASLAVGWTPLDVRRPPDFERQGDDFINARAALRYTP